MKTSVFLCAVLAVVVTSSAGERALFYDAPAPSTIRQVHILMRHGARAPLKSYPNDPNNNEALWEHGWGHLLKEGFAQHDNLGRWLRRRYDALLAAFPNASQIQVTSTEVDRTINSAQANMAGLFYLNNESDRYSRDLPYAPVPLKIKPKDADELLRVSYSTCSTLRQHEEIMRHTDAYRLELERSRPLLETLSRNLGEDFTKLEDVARAYDTFTIEEAANLTLPAWTEEVMPEMQNVSRFVYDNFYTGTDDLLAIRASPLLTTIMKNMEHKANSSRGPAMYVYSAHDITVLVQLKALGLGHVEQPPYASAVVFELHQRDDGSYFVRVFYHSDSTMGSDPLFITSSQCPPAGECDLPLWVAHHSRFDTRRNSYAKHLCSTQPKVNLIHMTAIIGAITCPFFLFCTFLAVIITRKYYIIKYRYERL